MEEMAKTCGDNSHGDVLQVKTIITIHKVNSATIFFNIPHR